MISKYISLVLYALAVTAATHRVATGQRQTNIMTLSCYIPGHSLVVAGPSEGQRNATQLAFGSMTVFDRPMTETPDPTSKSLGYARGFFVTNDLAGTSILDVFMLDFLGDRFNGSVGLYGTENLLTKSRVLPLSGGSGDFLFIKGYAVFQPMVPLSDETTDGGLLVATTYNITLHYKKAASLKDF